MILEQGEKIHVVERRLFVDDVRRHFIGEVLKCTERAVRARGYVWVFDAVSGQYIQKPEKRERIFALDDRLIINVIPSEADIEATAYISDPQKGLLVTDRESFFLEITEFTAMR